MIANALIVRAWNAQLVESEVARVEGGTEHVLLLPREPERRVHQQRRTERPRLTGRHLIDLRVAAAAFDGRDAEIVGQIVDDRVHVAELGPELVRGRAVPVELRVVVLAVDRAIFLALVIVRVPARADPLY